MVLSGDSHNGKWLEEKPTRGAEEDDDDDEETPLTEKKLGRYVEYKIVTPQAFSTNLFQEP
ncbi:hypothetical protein RUM43_003447 [Polyplax serrata]|uniref:Uncharacterized protein n=1 Tax=Polyplax serrata TaxID=468196 RepID=A0AAN8S374_POLSC